MTDDREPFREARAAGLQKRHEQRLENATYTAAEVKVLTEAALRLGRKEAGEEIAGKCELDATFDTFARYHFAAIARSVARQPAPEAGTGRQEACASPHPMASHIHCVRPAGHKSDHVSRNGRNWRPKADPTSIGDPA